MTREPANEWGLLHGHQWGLVHRHDPVLNGVDVGEICIGSPIVAAVGTSRCWNTWLGARAVVRSSSASASADSAAGADAGADRADL